jgi:NTE family protein
VSALTDLVEPNNFRLLSGAVNAVADVAREVRADTTFARRVARAILPGHGRNDVPPLPAEIFPPRAALDVPALRGRRVGLVASGGSGALASLCGVRRALDEAGVTVTAISACSGAALFASLWAVGKDADEMARFWLTLRTCDYVDPDWRALLRAVPRRLAGWTGLLAGDAVEHAFRAQFGDLGLGDLAIPLSIPVWNVDLNRLETIGTLETPDLPLAVAVRVAISIPVFVQAVRIGDHLYGDGGIVSVFPTAPIVQAGVDLAIGVNCYFPEGFQGEDLTGWDARSWSVLRASPQLRACAHLELAREQARLLGDRLLLLHPVPYTSIRGARFYETFLDRTSWPAFMRAGHACTRSALLAMAKGEGDRPFGQNEAASTSVQ